MSTDLLALTLWPEWAWAVDLPFALAKRVENRGWAPPAELVGPAAPWIALHAGKHIGGRSGSDALLDGLEGVLTMGRRAGLLMDLAHGIHPPDSWGLRARCVPGGPFVQCNGPRWGFPVKPERARPIRTSAIIGLIRVVRVLRPGEEGDEPGVRGWKVPDAYGWVFHYRPLKSPVSAAGKQKLWKVDAATAAAVWRQAEVDHA